MASFYQLEEAARVLGISPEELKQKAQQREIRAFMGSGNWQFRVADVEEYARQMGQGSSPEMSLTDLEMPHPGGDVLDLSEFQMGAADPDIAPPTLDLKAVPAVPSAHDDSEDVLLFDDLHLPHDPNNPSSSRIIGMEPEGKHPSDSDVRLLPSETGLKEPSDSDVSLSSSDDLPTLQAEGGSGAATKPISNSGDTSVTSAAISDSSQEIGVAPGHDSDFELSPTPSAASAVKPDSGSDFELPLLEEQSDEFSATPIKQASDSDVTAIGMGASGVNLAKPSDSGINLQGLTDFGPDTSGSIELAPLSGSQVKASPSPQPARSEAPSGEKDIFSDTDFELDVKASQTMQLDDSDFNLDDSSLDDGSSEIISLAGDEDVDANAATSMREAVLDEEEPNLFGDGSSSDSSAEEDADWAEALAPSAASSSAVAPAAGPRLVGAGQQAEWGGLWVGLLGFATFLSLMTAFLALDLVRNMYTWRGETPVASGIIKGIAGLFGG